MSYLPVVARRLTYLILTAAALAVLFLGWNAWRNSRSLSDAEMLNRLPTTDAVVVSIDFAQLRHSGIFSELVGSKVMEEADYQAFVRDSGFDYKRDLEYALVSFTTSGSYFVVRGRFDWKRLQAYAGQSGGSCYNDLCHMPGSQPDRHISFLPLKRCDGLGRHYERCCRDAVTPGTHASRDQCARTTGVDLHAGFGAGSQREERSGGRYADFVHHGRR